MAIIVNGVTIPATGNNVKYVTNGVTADMDKVIVNQGVETVVWEKIKEYKVSDVVTDAVITGDCSYTWTDSEGDEERLEGTSLTAFLTESGTLSGFIRVTFVQRACNNRCYYEGPVKIGSITLQNQLLCPNLGYTDGDDGSDMEGYFISNGYYIHEDGTRSAHYHNSEDTRVFWCDINVSGYTSAGTILLDKKYADGNYACTWSLDLSNLIIKV